MKKAYTVLYTPPYKAKIRPDFQEIGIERANIILEKYGKELGVSSIKELEKYLHTNHRGYILPPILSPIIPPELLEKLNKEQQK